MISFTIGQSTYNGEAGQTFAEWVESDDNTDGFELDANNKLVDSEGHSVLNSEENTVEGTDIVEDNGVYTIDSTNTDQETPGT